MKINSIAQSIPKGYQKYKRNLNSANANYMANPVQSDGYEKRIKLSNAQNISFYGKINTKNDFSEKGINAIVGYNTEKEKLKAQFINPVIKAQNTRNQTDRNLVPDGLILYGPTGSGKTYIMDKLTEHLQEFGTNVKEIVFDNENHTKNASKIKLAFIEAEDNFKKTGKYTIIKFPEDIGGFFLDKSKDDEFLKETRTFLYWADSCASKGAIWIATANNPKQIDKSVLRRATVKMPIGEMKDFPIGDMIKYSILKHGDKNQADNFDYQKVVDYVRKTGEDFTPDEYEEFIQDAINSSDITADGVIKEIDEYIAVGMLTLDEGTKAKFKEDQKYVMLDSAISSLLSSCKEPVQEPDEPKEGLRDLETQNQIMINIIGAQNAMGLSSIAQGNDKFFNFLIDLDNTNKKIKNSERLKKVWLNSILNNPQKANELTNKALDSLEKENRLIKLARERYRDIIDNDDTITEDQREILIQQAESVLFFKVVKDGIELNDVLQLEINILDTLQALSAEKQRVLDNAYNNIFNEVKDTSILSSNNDSDIENVNFVFNLLNQRAQNGSKEEKDEIKNLIYDFEDAKENCSEGLLEESWQKLIHIAREEFKTRSLDDLTNQNIVLLNSINNFKKDIKDKAVLELLERQDLTIEQKDFVARYAKDKKFKEMIKNSNVDINAALDDLISFEARNKEIIYQADIEMSDSEFNNMMSNRFNQINRNNKDINIQGDRIVSKLGKIDSSVNEFANSFVNYSENSLELQIQQLEKLGEISQNTKDIKQYTQAMTRAKLIELQKNEYYKEIVPELTSLLPNDKQIDIKDFLQKVDELAKYEKNDARKKKLLKAAAIIAGVTISGVALYNFGPAVVTHLASKITADGSTKMIEAMSAAGAGRGISEKLGISANRIPFGSKSGLPLEYETKTKDILKSDGRSGARAVIKEVDKIYKEGKRGGISMDDIETLMKKYGVGDLINKKG